MIAQKIVQLLLLIILTTSTQWLAAENADETVSSPKQSDHESSLPLEELSFDQLYRELKQGPEYSNHVSRGISSRSRKHKGGSYYYSMEVPETYTPQQSYPMHIILHGGVDRKRWRSNEAKPGIYRGLGFADAINVFPTAWNKRRWWHKQQVANIQGIIADIKQEYNIDNNRIFVHGISDGGTGSFHVAANYPTQFAGFIPMIGSPYVILKAYKKTGNVYPFNLSNKPLLAFNGTSDHLYPSDHLLPLAKRVNSQGGSFKLVEIAEGGHNMDWYQGKRSQIETFVSDHTRDPYPDSLHWVSDKKSPFKRIHWLVIDSIKRGRAQGAIEAYKQDNTIVIANLDVKKYTLLLSPEHFDFSREIKVIENKQLRFQGRVKKSKATLLHWHTIDRDRTQLYAAELTLPL